MGEGASTAHPGVIARRIAPKQPRGMSISVRASPLGCFAALAMTRMGWWMPPNPGFAGTSPRGGRSKTCNLPPLGEVARSAEGGLVFLKVHEKALRPVRHEGFFYRTEKISLARG